MIRNIITLFLFIFSFQVLNSKPLVISGLEKLNLNDIQAITVLILKK
jgi:hypothetical protein